MHVPTTDADTKSLLAEFQIAIDANITRLCRRRALIGFGEQDGGGTGRRITGLRIAQFVTSLCRINAGLRIPPGLASKRAPQRRRLSTAQ